MFYFGTISGDILYDDFILENAINFFDTLLTKHFISLDFISDQHTDILINGIGVGSYYSQKLNEEFYYSCGTGLALPKFSIVLEEINHE